MENWKELFDDEGRSLVEFLKERNDYIVCVACSQTVFNKGDLEFVPKIYKHSRSIEHGFKLYLMLYTTSEVIDLCDDRKNWSPEPKTKNVEVTRSCDGSLKISGFNPIEYVIPIVDLKFIKTPVRFERSSLDNYLTKESSSPKRKSDSSEQNSSVSSTDQVTSHKKRKTSQLTLERWVKNYEQVDLSVSTSPQNIPQKQVKQVTQISSLSEGLTRINEVRPTKRGISQIIRARVDIKSDIHPFFNFLGPTTMFTLVLTDESGEIRMSAYGASVNKLYNLVEVGRIYCFSKFKVKLSDPAKTPVIGEYNISCTEDTIIRPCVLMPLEIPKTKFNFQPIANVAKMVKEDIVDVLGIIESFGGVQSKRLSNGSPGRNRAIWLVDQSKTKILLYIWGSNADNFEENRPGDVIAVKRAKVKTFAKLNLDSSCLSSSTFKINPKLPEADALRTWYREKKNTAMKVLSSLPRPTKI